MGTHWPKPGLNSVSEYQASGYALPLTGSANIRYLKYVASSITFTEAGSFAVYDSGHNKSEIATIDVNGAGTTFKGKFLTFISEGDCIVELTNIPSASYAEHGHLSASFDGTNS
jgi:hypothetical protein